MTATTFITDTGPTTTVTLAGRLDFATAGDLMAELKTLEGTGVTRIDFNCADLEYISSAGIRAMVYVKQKIDRTGQVAVYLHDAAPQVREVFALAGLEDYFEFVAG
jgi:anti-sigma B factor antagonist